MNNDAFWLDRRPRITETCPRCRGCGTIQRSYALAPTEEVRDAPEDAIRTVVVGSFDIWTACKEAAAIVAAAGKPVVFEFLDHTVVVKRGDDPIAVGRAWWHKQYNETPEQTATRR